MFPKSDFMQSKGKRWIGLHDHTNYLFLITAVVYFVMIRPHDSDLGKTRNWENHCIFLVFLCLLLLSIEF